MTVRQLKKVLADLPPEYEDSIVLTEEMGFGGLAEATRLVYYPMLEGFTDRPSYWQYDHAFCLDGGGPSVSTSGAASGMKVIGYTPGKAPPTRTRNA